MKRLLVVLAVVMAATGAVAKSRKHVKNADAQATSATQNPNGEWRIESATTVGGDHPHAQQASGAGDCRSPCARRRRSIARFGDGLWL